MSEVQSIVKWANETGTPLFAVSSGPPHSNGDTVPGVDGAVIVDLSGMKQIIRVDRRNRVAMIEPGVTFGKLIPALAKEGLAPLITFLPRHNKFVVTSFLERTPITEPIQHWEPI
jgi:FAD/FMN-containing dehydrogenase